MLNKIGSWVVYSAKYVIYLFDLIHWKIKEFFKTHFPSLYNRLVSLGVYILFIYGFGVLILIAILGVGLPKLINLINVPRPPPFTAAPATSGYDYQAKNNYFNTTAYVGDSKNNSPKVESQFKGGETASFVLSNINSNISKPTQSGNTITFSNVRNNIDLKYETLVNGLKESLIVKSPEKGNTFTFDLNTKGATPRQMGTIIYGNSFYDSKGNYLFGFVKPFAFDAKGEITNNVVLTIFKSPASNNSYIAKVVVNQKWLNDPKRVYPITVDPTITYTLSSDFAAGTLNRVFDTGSGSSPNLTTYYQELPADQYTVGLWHMDEASGNVMDSSGNGNTGTPTGTTVVAGQMGNGRSFNGSSDWISVGNTASLQITGALTAEAWIKTSAAVAYGGFIGKMSSAPSYGYVLRENGSGYAEIGVGSGTGSTYTSAAGTTKLNDGNWHHIAGVYIPSTSLSIYVDGLLQNTNTTSIPASIYNTAAGVSIGSTYSTPSSSEFFNGSLDEVRISNVARSAEEIRLDAQRRPYGVYTSPVIDLGSPSIGWNPFLWTEAGVETGDGETLSSTSNLVAQWNFNSTSGTTATNDAGSCGTSCNGTLTNFASTASQDQAAGSGWTAANARWPASSPAALMFNGSNNTVVVGNPTALQFDRTNAFSIEAWVKTNSTAQQAIVSKDNSASPYTGYELTVLTGGTVGFGLNNTYSTNSINVNTNKTINDGGWHHIVSTYDGSSSASGVHIYIDGTDQPLTVSYNNLSASIANSINVNIGSRNNAATFFNGVIDSSRIYSRALTASEILSNYNAANLEFQTRVGTTTDPNDGTWEAWKPQSTVETQIDSLNGPYQYNITDSGLISYWPMDESSGTTVADAMGANAGTAASSNIGTGKFSNSRNFNGTSDTISIANQANFSFERTNTFSIEAWVKTNTANEVSIFGKRANAAPFTGYDLELVSGKVYMSLINTYNTNMLQVNTTNTVNDNRWHHIVMTYAGTSAASGIHIYIDGTDQALTTNYNTLSSTILNSLTPYIGSRNNSAFYFSGNIDEVRVYNSVVSAATVLQHSLEGSTNASLLRPSTDTNIKMEGTGSEKIQTGQMPVDAYTIGLWHLDETGGTGAYLKDSSSNGNNGTPVGTTTAVGIIGNARNFNGSSYITISSSALAAGGTKTVEAWIKTSTPQGLVFNSYDGTNGYELYVNSSTGNAMLWSNGGGVIDSGVSVTDGRWHHLAATWDGTTGVIYVDGISKNSAARTITTNTSNQAQIGVECSGACGTPIGWYFNGVIDEVRVSNIARSADEIAEDYRMGRDYRIGKNIALTDLSGKLRVPFQIAATRPGTYLEATVGNNAFANYEPDINTVGLWHLDEQSGLNFKDSSGYGYNSSISSGTTYVQGKIGKARYFNGSSDYISMGNVLDQTGASPFSISAWINSSAGGATVYTIVSKASMSSPYTGYQLGFNVVTGSSGDAGKLGAALVDGSTTIMRRQTVNTYNDGKWHHVVFTYDGSKTRSGMLLYVDGYLATVTDSDSSSFSGSLSNTTSFQIGSRNGANQVFNGTIDEIGMSNVARSAADIRAAYEYGKRTHEITIDFAAQLDPTGTNLITGSTDLSFIVDATKYGLVNQGSNLYPGDKVVVHEDYNGTDYYAQGTVGSITASTGAVTVESWDAASTFPSGGFTSNANVFKWQREYMDLTGILPSQRNAITRITLRETNGNEGRNIWLDDVESVGHYLNTPSGSTITSSTGDEFIQYRAIYSSNDYNVSSSVNSTTVDFSTNAPNPPVIGVPTPSTTSIQWNFTSGGGGTGGITGYKEYDSNGNEISGDNNFDCYTNGSATYCTETGLAPNTSYTRKIAAYNSYGRSLFSGTTTGITLAAVPPAPSLSSPTSSSLVLSQGYSPSNPGGNPSDTLMAIYQITGTACPAGSTGSGGFYLSATGGNNGSTPVWQASSAWQSISITGLNLDSNQYVFCSQARNRTNNIATNFVGNSTDGGYIPLILPNGNFTMTGNMTFASATRYTDGNNAARTVTGLDAGPNGWWKFDESSGNAVDSSGRGNTGTPTGTTIVTGKFGNARTFNGTTDYVDMGTPSNGSLDMGTGNLTIDAWIKTSSSAYQTIAGKARFAPGYFCGVSISTAHKFGCVIIYSSTTIIVEGVTSVDDGNWHHVAGVYNRSGNLTVYVDGVAENSQSISSLSVSSVASTNDFAIGMACDSACANKATPFSGTIDDVHVYPTALTAFQVKQDMSGSNPQNVSNFILSSGTLTVQSNQTVTAGQFTFPNGSTASIAVPTDKTGYLSPSAPLWMDAQDGDNDGYFATGSNIAKAFYGSTPTFGKRKSAFSTLTSLGTDCDDTSSAIHLTNITGGTITRSGNNKIHTFTSTGTLTVTCYNGATNPSYLIVAGGGAGGSLGGGGGGAGGVLIGSTTISLTSYTITVGGGGATLGANGGNSSFNGITSSGGGGGGGGNGVGGGSGGGASGGGNFSAGAGIAGQGYAGGGGDSVYTNAGGGGGAGGSGGSGWTNGCGGGGIGTLSSISGVSTYYGGGGGGGAGRGGESQCGGGAGGGGTGQNPGGGGQTAGTPNTGGGGGSGAGGGSGIVIISYPDP